MLEPQPNETEANRKTIRDAFDAWRDGTGTITDVFAVEMVWRIEGRSIVSKQYAATQQFVDEVMAPTAARFIHGEPFRPIAIRAVHADGDTVIVRWDGHGVANDGRAYDNSYAWFLKMADGKVIEGTAFFDSISLNELWARVPADAHTR
jgi:ketosteroid isomerase-like protein